MVKKRECNKSTKTRSNKHGKPTPTFKNTGFHVEDVPKNTASEHILEETVKDKLKFRKNPAPNAGIIVNSANRSKKAFKAKNANKVTTMDKKVLHKPVLNTEMMKDGVESLLTFLVKSAKNQESKYLFQSDAQDVLLQVSSFRVPSAPSRYLRYSLPHTLWTDTSDVCLFVRDSNKYRKDFEPSVKFYQDILEKNNITEITQVIPLKQVKAEYRQYEQQRQLCNQFDMFLSDTAICGHVLHAIGRDFVRKRKIPTPLRMDAKNLKNVITKALSKTIMHLHSNGNSFTIKVGHTRQSPQDILENIQSVCNGLSQDFPGGWKNIQNLYIKTEKSLAVPLYVSLESPNSVRVPKVESKRAKHNVPVEGELSTIPGMRVSVLPSGDIVILEKKIDSDLDSDTEIQQHPLVETGKFKMIKTQNQLKVRKEDLTDKVSKEEKADELVEDAEEAYLTEWKRKHEDDVDELRKRDDKSETPKKKKKKFKKT